MKLKAFGIGTALAAVVLTGPADFAQQANAPAKPATCPVEGFSGGFSRGCPQKQFANPADISAMMAALPDKPYATPQRLRRVLVLCRAVGWVHTSIPLAAKMVEYLGDRTGAWMTTITYDAAAITPENLKQYDAIFLASTTGEFLDDPNDKAATDLRRRRSLTLSKAARVWPASTRLPTAIMPMSPTLTGTWPEFNEMIGGFFKFHWTYPTLIPVKVDDPNSPLTAHVAAPRLRDRGRDLHVRARLIQPQAGACSHQHQLRQDERGRQSQRAGSHQAHRRRLRVELHSARGQWPRVLRRHTVTMRGCTSRGPSSRICWRGSNTLSAT
jgi:hypothetical protein